MSNNLYYVKQYCSLFCHLENVKQYSSLFSHLEMDI